MSRKARHCGLVITAQTICLGVGLWMNHNFVASSIRRDVERQASERLSVTAERLAAAPDPQEKYRQEPSAIGSVGSGAVMLDDGGRIAEVIHRAPTMSTSNRWTREMPFPAWHALPNGGESSSSVSLGTFSLNATPFLAARVPLKDKSGRQVVVFADRRDIERTAAALTAPLLPISALTLLWCCALLGVGVYLIMSRFYDDMHGERHRTRTDRLRQSQEIVRTRDAVIFGLAKLADSRDPETGDHLERITAYSIALASALRRDPRFADRVSPAFVRLIGISSALHDIGKVGIEDKILLKPAPLSDDEREAMQLHPVIGGKCLEKIERRLGSSNFLQMAREVAFAHHEKWDGTGYPLRLKGAEIPLAARIVAVADVYDALSSRRVYKHALPHDKCVEMIRQETGGHFDPEIIDVWVTIESQYRRIAQQYAPNSNQEGDADSSARAPVSPESVGEDDANKNLVLPSVGGAN